ncbi:hypothetical protein Mapa_017823 [Marchantia paleacea]|nr:hypothetical protein Mapa_017823 [Marchantia paleacea]
MHYSVNKTFHRALRGNVHSKSFDSHDLQALHRLQGPHVSCIDFAPGRSELQTVLIPNATFRTTRYENHLPPPPNCGLSCRRHGNSVSLDPDNIKLTRKVLQCNCEPRYIFSSVQV